MKFLSLIVAAFGLFLTALGVSMAGWVIYLNRLPEIAPMLPFRIFEYFLPEPHSAPGKVVGVIFGVLFLCFGIYCLSLVRPFWPKSKVGFSEEDFDYRHEWEGSRGEKARRKSVYEKYTERSGDSEDLIPQKQ